MSFFTSEYGENITVKEVCIGICIALTIFSINSNIIQSATIAIIYLSGVFLIAPYFSRIAYEHNKNTTAAFTVGALGMFGLFIPTVLYYLYSKTWKGENHPIKC